MSRKDQLQATVWPSDPHTLLKHQVYRLYLHCWMPKILQAFPKATIVDAFAGPGVYADGPPGSSVVAANALMQHRHRFNFAGHLDVICLEERPDRVDRLREEVEKLRTPANLNITVLPPGRFAEQQASLSAMAHDGKPDRPVLWLLDPFQIKPLGYDLIQACLAGPRDEIISTFMTDEMYRFRHRANFDKTISAVFGGERWKAVVSKSASESITKNALADAYLDALRLGRPDLRTGRFSIKVKNDSARYDLMYATHDDAGMQCWNPVKWRLDRYAGKGASASTAEQEDLFGEPVLHPLRRAVLAYAGSEQPWSALHRVSQDLGHTDAHLRTVLDDLAADGLAVRVDPMAARSPWPEDSTIRFWHPDLNDTDEPVAQDDVVVQEALPLGGG